MKIVGPQVTLSRVTILVCLLLWAGAAQPTPRAPTRVALFPAGVSRNRPTIGIPLAQLDSGETLQHLSSSNSKSKSTIARAPKDVLSGHLVNRLVTLGGIPMN